MPDMSTESLRNRHKRRRPIASATWVGMVATAFLLTACGDNKTASKANFRNVLTAFFNKHCATLPLNANPFDETTLPASIEADGSGHPAANADPGGLLEAFTKIGLLSSKPKITNQTSFGFAQTAQMLVFSLTPKGQALYQLPNSAVRGAPGGFCAGHIRVVSIDSFTAPADEAGRRVSQVMTTAKTDYDDWTKAPPIRAAFQQQLDQGATQHTMPLPMVLMNDGWAIDMTGPQALQ